jgi:hypothetical protein
MAVSAGNWTEGVVRMSSWLIALAVPLMAFGSLTPARAEQWSRCLYNNQSIDCRRTFLCSGAPCGVFKLEWKDGASDVFTRYKDGVARNVGYYKDTRGGEWILRGFAGSFSLRNVDNGNTIVYDMTLSECRESMLADFCSR